MFLPLDHSISGPEAPWASSIPRRVARHGWSRARVLRAPPSGWQPCTLASQLSPATAHQICSPQVGGLRLTSPRWRGEDRGRLCGWEVLGSHASRRERRPGPRRQAAARKLGCGRPGGKPGKETPREGARGMWRVARKAKGYLGKTRQCREGGPAAG